MAGVSRHLSEGDMDGIGDDRESNGVRALAQQRVQAHVQARIQDSRLGVYTLASASGLIGLGTGVLQVRLAEGALACGLGVVSALALAHLYRQGRERPWMMPAWMLFDVLMITWGVHITGGLASPWFIWYLALTSATAFAAGGRAALGVVALQACAYLALLSWRGDARGFDSGFWQAVVRLLFLNSAALFSLRGIVKLREKRGQVERLRQEDAAKMEQLTALAQDLDQGTRALAEANVQIREADRMKSQFLANMSHELRTPLNSIIGFSEVLAERLATQIEPRYLRFLRNIHGSGQHLLSILNDILDLSKVEAGRMELHPEAFPVAQAVESVLNVMQAQAGQQRIEFELDLSESVPMIEADPAKFKQILYNLLSNAVKFSPPGASVKVTAQRLSASLSPLGEAALELAVIDHGIGIAPENHEAVFREFFQVEHAGAGAVGGTGLGLSIVKKFTELMGGRVTLASAPGHGSTFRVCLPLQVSLPRTQPLDAALGRPLAGANRVLVVEDDLAAYQSLARWLSEAGYFPIRARQGEQALELARSLRPTAITLDLVLPGLSGFDVLRELKRDPRTRHVPVVIVSLMDNRELGMTLGVDDYFLKPVEGDALVQRLRELAPPSPVTQVSRLLVVDDEQDMHDLLGPGLRAHGFEVEHAHSAREALSAVERACPDAIVLDLLMPDMNGFDLAAALQERPDTAHVPLLVLTGMELAPADRARLEGRIEALVAKGPRTPARLVTALRELESRRQRELARAQ
jgi:signal transduction histidine kinase/DNA-binding response OmpR family regulator